MVLNAKKIHYPFLPMFSCRDKDIMETGSMIIITFKYTRMKMGGYNNELYCRSDSDFYLF